MPPDVEDNVVNRRKCTDMKEQHYQFWKVRRQFDLASFGSKITALPEGVKVRVVRIFGSNDDIHIFCGHKK